jgi:hypothetical protein
MSKDAEYRHYAAKTMDLAQRASSADKGRLLRMTEAWLDLADRVQRGASDELRKARKPHLIRAPLIENREFE